MKFACFGGAAAVADETMAAARHRRGRKLFPKSEGDRSSPSRSKASSSPETKTSKRWITSPGRRRETDFDIYMAAAGKSSSSSSSTLSTATSLDSACSSSYSSSRSSSRSSSSSSLSSLDATPPQPATKRRPQTDEQIKKSPAVGAVAVLVCLVMMMFGGRLAATLLTAAVLCFFPRQRQCPAYSRPTSSSSSTEPRREAIDARAAVMEGFLARNRKQ